VYCWSQISLNLLMSWRHVMTLRWFPIAFLGFLVGVRSTLSMCLHITLWNETIFSKREQRILNNCGVILTLIHWLWQLFIPWWPTTTLAHTQEKLKNSSSTVPGCIMVTRATILCGLYVLPWQLDRLHWFVTGLLSQWESMVNSWVHFLSSLTITAGKPAY